MASYLRGSISVLEFGAGIGTLAIEWEKQTGLKPECLETDANQQQIVSNRGFVCYRSFAELNKMFDGIYSSNVFEHIENDFEAFQAVHSILAEHGTLVVFVPAFICLFSALDRSLGHFRRYRKNDLIGKAKRAGFQIIDCHYFDSIGSLAWFIALRSSKRDGGKLVSPASLRFYDKWVFPVSRFLDRLFMRLLVGKNLLLIPKKKPVAIREKP
jgi:hypothetical protein